jgi:hypothetical protein
LITILYDYLIWQGLLKIKVLNIGYLLKGDDREIENVLSILILASNAGV